MRGGKVMAGLAAGALWATSGGAWAAEFKGLEVAVLGIERSQEVSLIDCPPGASKVHGVIRPGDDREYVTVRLGFRRLPGFKPGALGSVSLQDKARHTYVTSQAFGEIEGLEFTCTFSFRTPKGAEPARLLLDKTVIDLGRP